jgi:hypothetical protein
LTFYAHERSTVGHLLNLVARIQAERPAPMPHPPRMPPPPKVVFALCRRRLRLGVHLLLSILTVSLFWRGRAHSAIPEELSFTAAGTQTGEKEASSAAGVGATSATGCLCCVNPSALLT